MKAQQENLLEYKPNIMWEDPEPSPADAAFWKFHRENPEVFDKLVELTLKAKSAGRKRIGMKMLFEVVRWNTMMNTRGDVFKLNNNYAPRYARIIVDKYPELNGMFETRRIRT